MTGLICKADLTYCKTIGKLMPYKLPDPKAHPIDPKVMDTVEARWRGGEPLPVTTDMLQLDIERVRELLLERGYKEAQDRWNTRHCGVPENDLYGPFTEAEHEKLENWLQTEVQTDPKLAQLLDGVENSNSNSLMAARRLFRERHPLGQIPEPRQEQKTKWLDQDATKTKVIDDDVDEVRVEFGGREIRSWTYQDEAERRIKIGLAREFAEGFYQAQLLAQPDITADPNLGTGQLREDLITLRDKIKGGSRQDGDLLASAVNRLNELSSATSSLLGSRTAGEHPKPSEKRPDASSALSM